MPFEVIEQTGPSYGFGDSAFMDGILDGLPANAPQHDIDRAIFNAIRRDLHKPKTAKTVRAHFLMHWPIIAPMADRESSLFDQLIEECHSALCDKA